jgi:hypothetical protein
MEYGYPRLESLSQCHGILQGLLSRHTKIERYEDMLRGHAGLLNWTSRDWHVCSALLGMPRGTTQTADATIV